MNPQRKARDELYRAYGVHLAAQENTDGQADVPAATVPVQATPLRKDDMLQRLAARIAAEMPDGTVAAYLPVARAVLKEMREPSSEMLHSAFCDQLDYSDCLEDWQRMIDAALGTNQP